MKTPAKPIDASMLWKFSKPVQRLVGGLMFISAGLLVLSQFGQWFDAADMINHLLPPLLMLSAVLVAMQLGLGIRYRKSLLPPLAVACLVIGVTGRMVLPEVAAQRPMAPAALDDTYLFAIFNMKQRNAAPEDVVDWLSRNLFDFAVLLEADDAVVKAVDHAYPYSINCLANKRRCSTVIISTRKPVESTGFATQDPQNRKSLSAVKTSYCIDEQELTIIGAHLSRPWPPQQQNRDLKDLAGHLSRMQGRNIIVAGDFNLTPWSFRLRSFDRAVDLKRVTRTLFSWPADRLTPPLLPLDHIFISRSLRAAPPHTGDANGSDHLPVILRFSLTPGGKSAPDSPCSR